MDDVLRAASPILGRFKTVIVIGNSIGGYAAIKFSRRLRATHVLAVAPAYSLDVEEFSFENEQQRFAIDNNIAAFAKSRDGFDGMAIRAEDVSGRIVVVHNLQSPIDVVHVDHLRKNIQMEGMPLQHEGHNVFSSLERSETLSKIVDALRSTEPAGLLRAFRSIRRSIPDCVVPTLRHAMQRHPVLVDRAMRSEDISVKLSRFGIDQGPLSNELVGCLIRHGHHALATDRLERTIRAKLGSAPKLSAGGVREELETGRSYLLLSPRGRFLCARSMMPGLAASWNPFSDDQFTPVFASIAGRAVTFRTIGRDGRPSQPLDIGAGPAGLEWSSQDDQVMLTATSGLLTIMQDDTLAYRPSEDGSSSHFIAIAVDEPAALIKTRRSGWLEASAKRIEDSKVAVSHQPAVRSGRSGWSRLFGFSRKAG